VYEAVEQGSGGCGQGDIKDADFDAAEDEAEEPRAAQEARAIGRLSDFSSQ
jgi:hypothetical protein